MEKIKQMVGNLSDFMFSNREVRKRENEARQKQKEAFSEALEDSLRYLETIKTETKRLIESNSNTSEENRGQSKSESKLDDRVVFILSGGREANADILSKKLYQELLVIEGMFLKLSSKRFLSHFGIKKHLTAGDLLFNAFAREKSYNDIRFAAHFRDATHLYNKEIINKYIRNVLYRGEGLSFDGDNFNYSDCVKKSIKK